MSSPPLKLPTIQNWTCHNCGGCCKQHEIEVTPEEKERIEKQHWEQDTSIPAGQPVFVKMGFSPVSNRYRLAHQADGSCIFLDEKGLCRIHAKFGEPAKPLACQVYPYAFHPAGNEVAVSLRFSCPSVVANLGKPVDQQSKVIRKIADQVLPKRFKTPSAPGLNATESLGWPDTLKVVDALDQLFAAADSRFMINLLRALAWTELIEQSRFDTIRGQRIDEFLDLIGQATVHELPDDLDLSRTAPSRMGAIQFRLLVAQYARKDTFAEDSRGMMRRLSLLMSALKFASGRGEVPRLQDRFSAVPFSSLETPFGDLPPECEKLFIRYYRVKIQGLHFFGAAYYDIHLVEGFYHLALMFPAIMWIARWLAAGSGRSTLLPEDVNEAMSIADHHHGYSPAFGLSHFRSRVRNLSRSQDIKKLITWYGQ
ncbi:MAG: YkgJ family cysteine cluster protein [Planctomycetes bacterium]|nr:YkgJ family cysteine cluster protein [Planctomycetota bacterium]MCH9727474.1 YkgJ family cysteine cluster protein [Planctomycetota bacterium]MCH9775979.1 YkgJ family cysteine cluster protein [Planctomycetota bacterium]MCH9791985.1 YkgJ family cysteine cluster protein [Planctomycetota bacterium]